MHGDRFLLAPKSDVPFRRRRHMRDSDGPIFSFYIHFVSVQEKSSFWESPWWNPCSRHLLHRISLCPGKINEEIGSVGNNVNLSVSHSFENWLRRRGQRHFFEGNFCGHHYIPLHRWCLFYGFLHEFIFIIRSIFFLLFVLRRTRWSSGRASLSPRSHLTLHLLEFL